MATGADGLAALATWALAWLAMAVGLAWSTWAGWILRQAGNPLRPGAVPRRLVDEGPYRYGRHPMYLGGLLTAAGAAVASAQLAAMALVAALGAFLHLRLIPAEEALLHRRFGGWYSDYRIDVRRWF
jgi:protein-S-isoprenylcysteine O-methyltransferase Ste14